MSNPIDRETVSDFGDDLTDEALDRVVTESKASAAGPCSTHPTRRSESDT